MRERPAGAVGCAAPTRRRSAGRIAGVLVAALAASALATAADAQDPALQVIQPKGKSSFPPPKGGILGGTPKKIDKAQPLLLNADEIVYDSRGTRVVARGNVEVYYNNYVLTADEVIYDQAANTVTAHGNAKLVEPNGNIIRGETLIATQDFRDAFVQHLQLTTKDETRIAGQRLVRKDGNVTEVERGKFTPCKSDGSMPPLWCISANRIVHDQQAATVTYQDAQFELFGVPVLYLPYFQHGDPSVRRQTGFLIPEFHQSSTLGFGTEIPYYFALSPYYDFLFHPTYWSQHGVLWQGAWRHRVAWNGIRGEYSVKFAGIEQDGSTLPTDVSPERRQLYEGWRGSVETKGRFSLASWWHFGWDVTLESDDAFRRFYKLDSVLQVDRVNQVWLEGISKRNYFGMRFYHFGGLLIEDTPASESMVLPVIDYRYIIDKPVLGGELAFNANALSLTRSDGTDLQRASAEATWRRKLVDGIGQVWTPYLQARGDVLTVTTGDDRGLPVSDIKQDTLARGTATAALTYSYPWVWHVATASHTIEPIGQLITRPSYVPQRQLPNEDARSIVWADTLLFDYNKFSGWDRLETGTRANYGLQYSLQTNKGGHVRIVAGQSLHLAGENPYENPSFTTDIYGRRVYSFSPSSGLESQRSDYVLGAYIAPTDAFRIVAQSRFDENDFTLRRQDTYTMLALGPVALGAQHSYTRANPVLGINKDEHELVGSATLRITDHWSITGLLRYDIDDRFRLMDGVVVRYADECFVLTAQYTESFINNPDLYIKPDRSLMLRFEWKYLGAYSYSANAVDQQFLGPNGLPTLTPPAKP